MPYELFIGLRYLRAKRKQTSISVNTIISIAGVALGVTALIVVLSVMSGFQEDLQGKILGINSHIVILQFGGNIRDYRTVIDRVKTQNGVLSASPFIINQAMLSSGKMTQGVVLRGIDLSYKGSTTYLQKTIKEGSLDTLKDERMHGIILGKELSKNLAVFIGDSVNVISPAGSLTPVGMLPKMKTFKVIGIFDSGMFEFDSNIAYISLKDAQSFFEMGDTVTATEVRIDNIYKARELSHEIQQFLGPPYFSRSWMEMNRNLFSALKLEKIAMFIILVLIILVAAFNIVSTLIMIIIEKGKDIAILKSMGATNSGIMSIFIINGLMIGIVGTIIGVIGGYSVCYLLKTYQIITLPGDIYHITHLPVKMNTLDFIVISLSAIGISFLATLYPSWQAAHLDPAESLRYE
ncbi:MAG: lipoprotein-releasing ABC transporter permease subunit [Nitrospirota bacterium]